MQLEDLPTLVLEEIASYLALPDVIILAQQSDALHYSCEIRLRQLYRHIQLNSLEDCCDGFTLLLWALRWPPLGKYVHYIEMNTSYQGECFRIPRPSTERSISKTDAALLGDAVRRAGYQDEEYNNMWLQISTIPEHAADAYNSMSFATDEEKGRITAWAQALAAIFISIAPNLESLAFAPVSWEQSLTYEPRFMLKEFLTYVRQHPESPCALNLRNLCHISLLPWGQGTPLTYSSYPISVNMKLAGQLPAVETCSLKRVQSFDVGNMTPASFRFKNIHIHQSCLDNGALVQVIRSCKELWMFEYSYGSFYTQVLRSVIHNQCLLDALCYHSKTLRVLDLDLDDQRVNRKRHIYEDRHLDPTNTEPTSLADFSALTHLSIGIDLLLRFTRGFPRDNNEDYSLIEGLPPHLQYLCIYGYRPGKNSHWDEQVEELRVMVGDGEESLFTLRGVDEYLRHPSNPEPVDADPEAEGTSDADGDGSSESDSGGLDFPWSLAPDWYKEMYPRRRTNDQGRISH